MTMRRSHPVRTFLAAAAGALACAPAAAQTDGAPLTVRAENTLAIARPDETIGVPWREVQAQLPGAAAGQVRVRSVGTQHEIASQVVDDDGDGRPDELIFQSSFAPGEVKTFAVERGAPMRAAPHVYATHTVPRDDIAWESDRIAFRTYGRGLWKVDSLDSSGIDVWVKSVRALIVDRWYAKGHDAYHRDTGEGADFFDVGESLGAGGTAVWYDDSLYRAHNFTGWRIIANGPIRAIFELRFEPWSAGPARVTETKRIAIDAGQNLNRVVSTFAVQGAAEVPVAIGLVKRAGMIGSESEARPWAWLAGWGPVDPKNGGHGDLGTAVLLPRDRIHAWKETSSHYLAIVPVQGSESVAYYIGAGWTGSRDFRDVEDWWRYLDQAAQRIASPIAVTVGAAHAAAER
jgi:pectinesterase